MLRRDRTHSAFRSPHERAFSDRVPKKEHGVSDQAADARPDETIGINATIRSMLEGILNAEMDEQASELGVRERKLDTRVNTATLKIPKFREG